MAEVGRGVEIRIVVNQFGTQAAYKVNFDLEEKWRNGEPHVVLVFSNPRQVPVEEIENARAAGQPVLELGGNAA
ncbi:MAG: hypothetical protein A4E28_02423 [Methanocella sp. PtaU1.Bin125]|nr:MAG: hypothetical protein A4E28_02423 [Methanocella sp. PtaU1.Bin125]